MSRRLISVILSVAVFIGIFMFTGVPPFLPVAHSTADDIPLERFVVGFDRAYPPFEYLDELGRPAGYDIDLIRAVAGAMGFAVEFRGGVWTDIRNEFEQGKIDILSGLCYSDERGKTADFSVPHIHVGYSVFVRKGSRIKSIQDTQGSEIIIEGGDIMQEYVEFLTGKEKIVAVDTPDEVLRLLASGRHDCALLGTLQGRYLAKRMGMGNIEATGPPVLTRKLCFAVPKGRMALLHRLNEGLAVLNTDNRYEAIRTKWFGIQENVVGRYFRIAGYILLPSVLLLFIVWVLNRSLKKEVEQRTRQIRRALEMRIRAEEALGRSEARYRELVQNANSIILRRKPDGTITFFNEFAQKFFGYPEEEIIGKNVVGTIIPAVESSNRDMGDMVRKITENPGAYADNQNENMLRDGSRVWVAWTNRAIWDTDGNLIEILCIGNNITERKKAEEALKESEERYRELTDLLPQTVFEANTDGLLTFANRAGYETFQLGEEEIRKGLNVYDLLLPEDAEKARDFGIRKSRGEKVGPAEYTAVKKDGTTFPVAVYSSVFFNDGKPAGFRGILVDLTEHKQMEAELLKSQKLESLGVLAGGIAHDFNNILTAVVGSLSLARMYVEGGQTEKLLEKLDQTEKAAVRAQDLTRQLLTFSKGGAPVKRIVSLGDVIRDSATFALRGSNVHCEFFIDPDLRHADVDVGQINQVVNNLIINADQAMPHGGIISVRAENVEIGYDEKLPMPAGKYVRIIVEDDGTGISSEHLIRIFDPYFTTKPTGSGLGLATVYSIITKHGGHISVESMEGRGTAFYIYLPASEKKVEVAESSPERVFSGKGRILIMDDEDVLRSLLGELLRHMGYRSESARDGREAVELYTRAMERERPFDLVIMDLTVPGGMGGKEALERLLEIDPGIRAVATSGYSSDPVMADHARYGFCEVLKKPFKVEELAQILMSSDDARRQQGKASGENPHA